MMENCEDNLHDKGKYQYGTNYQAPTKIYIQGMVDERISAGNEVSTRSIGGVG